MKKYNKLMAFAAVLTMLAYTGCGGSMETNTVSEAPAADFAGEAVKGDASSAAAAPAVPEAAAAPEAAGFGDEGEAAGDVLNSADFDAASIAEGAEAALSAVKNADSPAASPSAEVDGERLAPEFSPEAYAEDDAIIEPEPVPEPEPAVQASVGMLTAGEWKDHENWGFFSNLVNTGVIEFPSFGLDPTQRIAVTVTDSSGTPLPNAEVLLNDEAQTIWRAVTDKNGQAYVFEMNGKTGANLTVTQGELSQTIEIESAAVDEQGNALTGDRSYTVQLDAEQKFYHDTQIMFIVDTTGSMGDEMLYLQSDFSAIAEEAGDGNTMYSVNFYKDEGDVYVTNCSGFTGDVQAVRNKLNDEFASGGGDEPEAVYEVLKETMFSPDWKDESVKIAFLIYDAPPHDGTDFASIIEEASAKGIHLVPVVSSNGSRETELFGRALAICTNGDYVFLTDDSGIGDSHLEPIIGDYEVESLHDIIVRIIQEYKQ